MSDSNQYLSPEARERKALAEAAQAEADAAKSIAEAEKVRVEIETLHAAEQRARNEEVRRAEVHAIAVRNNRLAVDAASAQFEVSKIYLQREARKEQNELATDFYNNVYRFEDSVTEDSVYTCVNTLTNWMRRAPGCNVDIVFNSPGGSVIDGMELFDFIGYMRAKGHAVTTVALGQAASMAGILLQAGSKRVMGSQAYLLIHQISTLAMGKVPELEDEVAFCKKIQGRVLDIFATRMTDALMERGDATVSAKPRARVFKEKRDFVAKSWERKDWWLDSDEALKHGIVDEVWVVGGTSS